MAAAPATAGRHSPPPTRAGARGCAGRGGRGRCRRRSARDHQAAPYRLPQLRRDQSGAQPGVTQREGDPPLLQPARYLVGHPRPEGVRTYFDWGVHEWSAPVVSAQVSRLRGCLRMGSGKCLKGSSKVQMCSSSTFPQMGATSVSRPAAHRSDSGSVCALLSSRGWASKSKSLRCQGTGRQAKRRQPSRRRSSVLATSTLSSRAREALWLSFSVLAYLSSRASASAAAVRRR